MLNPCLIVYIVTKTFEVTTRKDQDVKMLFLFSTINIKSLYYIYILNSKCRKINFKWRISIIKNFVSTSGIIK